MNSLKSLFVVAVLAALACGAYVSLNRNNDAPPPTGTPAGIPGPPRVQIPPMGTTGGPPSDGINGIGATPGRAAATPFDALTAGSPGGNLAAANKSPAPPRRLCRPTQSVAPARQPRRPRRAERRRPSCRRPQDKRAALAPPGQPAGCRQPRRRSRAPAPLRAREGLTVTLPPRNAAASLSRPTRCSATPARRSPPVRAPSTRTSNRSCGRWRRSSTLATWPRPTRPSVLCTATRICRPRKPGRSTACWTRWPPRSSTRGSTCSSRRTTYSRATRWRASPRSTASRRSSSLASTASANAGSLPPGRELKVVRGPFSALIDLDKFELTLMLKGRYAGRFPIGIGIDNLEAGRHLRRPRQEGESRLRGRRRHRRSRRPEQSARQTARSTSATSVAIHGTNNPQNIRRADDRGTICLSDRDIEDVFGILSVGSRVVIQR